MGSGLTRAGGKCQRGQDMPQACVHFLIHRNFVPLINRKRVLRPYARFWLARANIVLGVKRKQYLLASKSKTAVRSAEEVFSRID